MKSIKKILVVDDEALARERIRRFLSEISYRGAVEDAANGLEAIEKLNVSSYDLVLLDIQMPGLSGFDVLRQFESRNFTVVFQTAFDEYAIKAFDVSACDYLLKPFTKDRFEKAFLKVSKAISQSSSFQHLEDLHKKSHQFLESIVVKQNGRIRIVDLRKVECFISQDHYTIIFSEKCEFISDLSLNWIEEKIDPTRFIRCHRNNIVSISQISSIGGVQNSEVELRGGMKLPLSRNNRKRVFELFLG